jgi:transposase
MATVLEGYTTEEQRSVAHFLWAEGLTAKDIHKEMFPVYGGKCLSCKAVHNWVKKLCHGRSKAADDAQPSHPVEIATQATVQWVEELIQIDRRITIDSVATALRCSHGLAYSIMHDHLKFQKVGAQRTEGLRTNELNGSALATSLTECR